MKQCKEKTEFSKAFISAIVDQDLDFVREILPFADVNFKVINIKIQRSRLRIKNGED